MRWTKFSHHAKDKEIYLQLRKKIMEAHNEGEDETAISKIDSLYVAESWVTVK